MGVANIKSSPNIVMQFMKSKAKTTHNAKHNLFRPIARECNFKIHSLAMGRNKFTVKHL